MELVFMWSSAVGIEASMKDGVLLTVTVPVTSLAPENVQLGLCGCSGAR